MHSIIGITLSILIELYILLLVVRMVLSWVSVFGGTWQPKGFMLVIFEVIYTLTDPPINLANRFVPPLRIGGVGLDVGFMLVLVVLMGFRWLISMFLL